MSNTQNRFAALVFDDPYKADEARAALRRMVGEGLLAIGETALIESARTARFACPRTLIRSRATSTSDTSLAW